MIILSKKKFAFYLYPSHKTENRTFQFLVWQPCLLELNFSAALFFINRIWTKLQCHYLFGLFTLLCQELAHKRRPCQIHIMPMQPDTFAPGLCLISLQIPFMDTTYILESVNLQFSHQKLLQIQGRIFYVI